MRYATQPPSCAVGARLDATTVARKSLIKPLQQPPYCLLLKGPLPSEDPSSLIKFLRKTNVLTEDIEPPSVTRIEVSSDSACAAGSFTRKSRTSQDLAPHTDTSFRAVPHDLLAFQFVRVDSEGGESVLVSINDVLSQLRPALEAGLRKAAFPFGNSLWPILVGYGERAEIRYNRDQIELSASRVGIDTSNIKSLLDEFDAILGVESKRIQFRAEAGEILLINNKKCLHGRSSINPGSDRLLIRIRSYCAGDLLSQNY